MTTDPEPPLEKTVRQEPATRVTVVVLCKNGGSLFGEVVAAVQSQQFGGEIELLVADSGSTDGSPSLATAAGATVVDIDPATFNYGGTKNEIVRQLSSEIIVFLSQDARPLGASWLTSLVAPILADATVAGVTGRQVPRRDADADPVEALELAITFPAASSRHVGPVSSPSELVFSNANAAYRRELLVELPFEIVPFGEDKLWAFGQLLRGRIIAYAADAVVEHSHGFRLRDWYVRAWQNARAKRETQGYRADLSPVLRRHLSPRKLVGRIRPRLRGWRSRSLLERWRLVGYSLVVDVVRDIGNWVGSQGHRAD